MHTVAPLEQLTRGIATLVGQGMPAVDQACHPVLLAYVDLLSKWNRVYNLTAVRDPVDMLDRHILDSIVMSRWLPQSSDVSLGTYDVMDVGSGAGLPVLPLAILRPDLQFLSIESNGKKTRFQQQVLLELGIGNVALLNQRVETVTSNAHRVLSRAFTAPQEFLAIARSLCTHGGKVVVMLGMADRMPQDVAPSYALEALEKLAVPGTESARHVAVCRRLAE